MSGDMRNPLSPVASPQPTQRGERMDSRKAAGSLAAVVLIIAVMVGFWPHSIQRGFVDTSGETTVSCGSAFSPDDSEAKSASLGRELRTAITGDALSPSEQEYAAQCDDKLTTARMIALILGGLAALVLLFLTITTSPAEKAASRKNDE